MFSANTSQVAANAVNYIEDVFSTWLYTGNGSTQTITNGIDLAGKGGLVWQKNRSAAGYDHVLTDTTTSGTGALTKFLSSNTTNGQDTNQANIIGSYNSNGFTLNNGSGYSNNNGAPALSLTFREQPKFFDVVTYTGDGVAGRTVAHSLGAVPGAMLVKRTSSSESWIVYHRGLSLPQRQGLGLNETAAAYTSVGFWNDTLPTSTEFTLGTNSRTNTSGETYVAYLFAHNAGGFGLTGTDNVISCGSYTGTGSTPLEVNLGYEAQWVLIKRADGAVSWYMGDIMRGLANVASSGGYALLPNTSGAEQNINFVYPTATGFAVNSTFQGFNNPGSTYIYIAIRRGPMKVPTSGTSVFAPVSATPSGATTVTTNFPVDLAINAQRDSGTSGNKVFWDRLRGSSTTAGQGIFSNLTNAEVSYSGNGIGLQSNTTIVDNFWNTLNGATTPVIYWNMRRAPSFFDEVCYTGTGVARTINHNLGVAPELMITKRRNVAGYDWIVYLATLGATKYLILEGANAASTYPVWNDTAPTASVFSVGNDPNVNASGATYVWYGFATCPGVSKVGSYTGNGSTQTINCGFTGGARFVLIKRTDSTGDWYVYDTARGMTTLTDPYLLLNSTAAESATLGSVTTVTTGFAVNASILAAINTNGASYIFLAIA